MPHEAHQRPEATPESLFAAWLVQRERGGPRSISELCLAHPEHADHLRELWSRSLHGANTSGFFRAAERKAARPSPGLEPGKVVGEFRLTAFLAKGGMGEVWEAEQLALGRRVALKFVLPERISPRALELFRREARAGGRLNHPGIVVVHGHGESDGLAWIAMELVQGAWTLEDFLGAARREGGLPDGYEREVASFAASVADALQCAHDAGVVHRDIKPQNVLIAPDDRPKVTDFGLARIVDESALSRSGDFAATYLYMSPEQAVATRSGLDHRTDIFSLGVVLYEMLTLQRPFQGDTPQQVCEQILSSDPPDPRALRSRVPRDLAVIVGKALEKQREKRYASMSELALDLRRHLAHEPIRARPASRAERLGKWIRRHPTSSVAAALSAAAFAAITLLLAAVLRSASDLRDSNRDLSDQTTLAQEQQRIAEAQTAKVLRLSDIQVHQALAAQAQSLWPAYPELIPALVAWLERARALAGNLDAHLATLAEMRARALPWSAAQRSTDRETHPRLGELHEREAELEAAIAQHEGSLSAEASALSERRIAELDELVASLREQVGARRTWHFESPEDQWQHDVLDQLIQNLQRLESELLAEDATAPDIGWSVPRRLAFARKLEAGSAAGGLYAEVWAAALADIRAAYPGVELEPRIGLLPIGPDPKTGLWEFAHLMSGAPAQRGAAGKLELDAECGVVLVLLPGGRFWMGAQASEPAGRNYDPQADSGEGPVHEVELSPFFLAKHELTQAQWERLTGSNPSYYQLVDSAATSLHPVEQVSWIDCAAWLPRSGLELPSEAQWEYAARAGTTTPWWTGMERESLRTLRAANLADQAAARAGAPWQEILDWPELDDKHGIHAPVGSFAANSFGLSEIHGNVWEWCLDSFTTTFFAASPSRDPVAASRGAALHVSRGGGFNSTARETRSSMRGNSAPINAANFLGIRPAARIR